MAKKKGLGVIVFIFLVLGMFYMYGERKTASTVTILNEYTPPSTGPIEVVDVDYAIVGGVFQATFKVKNTGATTYTTMIELQPRIGKKEAIVPGRESFSCQDNKDVHTLAVIDAGQQETIKIALKPLNEGYWVVKAISYDSCCYNEATGKGNKNCQPVSPFYDDYYPIAYLKVGVPIEDNCPTGQTLCEDDTCRTDCNTPPPPSSSITCEFWEDEDKAGCPIASWVYYAAGALIFMIFLMVMMSGRKK